MTHVLGLALFAWLAFKKPHFAHGLILALLPAYLMRFTILGYPTTFLELMLLVFVLSVAITHRHRFNKLAVLGKLHLVIALFVLAGIISAVVSPEPIRALGHLKAFIIEPVLFFYATLLLYRNQGELKLSLSLVSASTLIISIFGIIQYFTHIYLPLRFWGTGEEPLRIVSVFEYPNALALYLAPLIVFFIGLYLYKPLVNRSLLLWTVFFSGIALIMTFSRGAWLGVLAGLFVLFLKKYGSKKAVAAMIAILALVLLIPQTRERVGTIFNDSSSFAHQDLMKVAVSKILDQPFLGNGLFGFRTTLVEAGFKGEILNYPHNVFLNFWLELGLLGLIAFALTISIGFRSYQKQPNHLKLVAACCLITIIVHGLVDVPYFKNDLSVMFWFIISLFYIPE